MKFIVMDFDASTEARNRALPFILKIPDEIKQPDTEKAKGFVLKILQQKGPERRWSFNKKFVLSESDAEASPEINRMFEFVDWDSVGESWMEEPKNYSEAYDYVNMVGPAPSVEKLIAQHTYTSYRYAMDILEDRFPVGEDSIAMEPLKALNYADKMKCRVKGAEEEISKNEDSAAKYGKIMKKNDLWESWSEDEVSRSPVWMYQYAKDHVKGSLPENLHNRMHLLAFSDSENRWVKKYIGSKKYMSEKVGG